MTLPDYSPPVQSMPLRPFQPAECLRHNLISKRWHSFVSTKAKTPIARPNQRPQQRPKHRPKDRKHASPSLRIVRTAGYGEASNPNTDEEVWKAVEPVLEELKETAMRSTNLEELDVSRGEMKKRLEEYRRSIAGGIVGVASIDGDASSLARLRNFGKVFRDYGAERFARHVWHDFSTFVRCGGVVQDHMLSQKRLADLRFPAEWFSMARIRTREIHLHIGPTNSGKTYHALKRLEAADSGIYAGPLRLLAHEVFSRMTAKGKRCALITGEERRYPDENFDDRCPLISATVEMVPTGRAVDVAVIDEIQMIADKHRGWAWTTAFMGVQAAEVHLCGEARTEPVVRDMCAAMGEKLHVHHYKRLSPLQMEPQSLDGSLKKLKKGDCVISFSVMGIHALKQDIEKSTGRNVAVIYGSLPPETRAQQARLFNNPDNDYDYLVASDAIGMGLNLSIRRIIFETSRKNNGRTFVSLAVPEIKQIAGRAGRYRTAEQAATGDTTRNARDIPSVPAQGAESSPVGGNVASESLLDIQLAEPSRPPAEEKTMGFVTTLQKWDHALVAKAMKTEPGPIMTAGIQPPTNIIERYARYFPPGTPLSYILLRLCDISQLHPRFHLCFLKDQLLIADAIEGVAGLAISSRLIFIAGPLPVKTPEDRAYVAQLAGAVVSQEGGGLLDLPSLNLDILDAQVTGSREYLFGLEQLHKKIIAYLWLSYRFSGIFITRALATHVKTLVEDRIEIALAKYSAENSGKVRAKLEMKIKKAMERQKAEEEALKAAEASIQELAMPPLDGNEAERGEPYFDLAALDEGNEDIAQEKKQDLVMGSGGRDTRRSVAAGRA